MYAYLAIRVYFKQTSMALMNFSASASSSHLHSSSLSGLVATTLRGPIAASAISLLADSAFVYCNHHGCGACLPAGQGE